MKGRVPERGMKPPRPPRLFETPDARLFRRKRVRDRVFRGGIPKVPQPTVIRLILPSLRVTPPPPSTFRGPPLEMEFRAGVRAEYQTDGGRYLDGTQPRKSRRISITRGRVLVLSALSSLFFPPPLLFSISAHLSCLAPSQIRRFVVSPENFSRTTFSKNS